MNRRELIVDLCCALIALVAIPSGFAQSFEKANQEFAAGDFKNAITEYEALVQKGEYSANLFYDLGNAYFRTNDFGKAILNYERALALDRHHPEAEANLRIARDEARALELQQSEPERYLRFANANQSAIAAAVAIWIALFAIAHLIFARRGTAGAITLSILSLSIFAFAVSASYWIENERKDLAIVTMKEVQARVATADSANSVLTLPPGSEIKLVSKRGDWIYATLPNNLRGWIPANSAEPVRL